jgi:hypothetical protein
MSWDSDGSISSLGVNLQTLHHLSQRSDPTAEPSTVNYMMLGDGLFFLICKYDDRVFLL